ncbi:LuxR family transcriptional regulator [Amycolatopsis sp. WAC 01416]|uniref:helix-turn-helix transcriptional regulator n=1 Tax=Amycolatopsis sp. WAC 01416 TaxID=2203196 RepID=UPI000F76EE3F|nr:LuxR family transcriptional regulator [Amycolatopsis sp. WAC 01416]RSN34617.1 LuxR family transcriptional regulator [Amycolatopsis sp. WAC 01416]
MGLIEREAEWDTLVGGLAAADRGEGRVVLVSGPGGAGRSELLAAFGAHAGDQALVLTATCGRSERHFGLGVIRQLFGSGALPAGWRGRIDELLGRAESDLMAPARDLAEVVLELAAAQPLVLIVDDLHEADSPSLDVLLYLQRRIATAPVLIVLSEVRCRRVAHPRFHAELTKAPWLRQVRLSTLSESGVVDLLRDRVPDREAAELAPRCHRLTGGSPVLLHALIDDLIESGAAPVDEDEPVQVGTAVIAVVLSCLHRWAPEHLAVARGLALLGDNTPASVVARLLDIEPVVVDQVLDELSATGLLDDGRFRHPAVPAAIRDDLALEGRAGLHLAAAQLLHEEGAPSREIAAQLLAAGDTGGATWAAAVLRAAALEALGGHALVDATACLELALRSPSGDRDRAATVALLVRVRWLTNPSAINRLLDPLHDALDAGHLGDRDAIVLSNYLLWRGDDRGVRRSAIVDRLAEHASDPRSEAELYFTRQWLSFSHPVRFPEPLQDSARSAPTAMRRTRRGLRLTDIMVHGASNEVLDKAEQVLLCCSVTDTMLESVLAALLTLVHGDRTNRALHWCSVLDAEARTLLAKPWIAALADIRAHIALRRGDLAAAERFARDALQTMSPDSWGVAIGSPMSTLMLATTGMGKLDEADRLVKQPVAESMMDAPFWGQYLRGRGYYYLASNRLHAALADFQACGDLCAGWGLDLPEFLPWRSDAAQAHLAMNQPNKARELLSAQLDRPGGKSLRVAGVSLRVLAGTCNLPRRPAVLGEAIAKLQETGAQLELALALAELGRAQHALGDSTRARLTARRAKQVAKSCFAEWLCEKVLPADEPTLVEEPDTFATLSEAERRVATLAAGGYTNRDISQKLFVTVSTVEQHLTRVYRKLNVNRRADLPADLPLVAIDSA